MMGFFLRDIPQSIHIGECGHEVWKMELTLQVVSVHHLPVSMQLLEEFFTGLLAQGGNAPLTRNARFFCQPAHSEFSGESLKVTCMCQ